MRLQIILQLRPNPRIGLFFEKIPEVFLPVLWFDAEAAIDEEMASQVPWPQCDTLRRKMELRHSIFLKELVRNKYFNICFLFSGKDVGSDANCRPPLWCNLFGRSCPLSCLLPLPQVGQWTLDMQNCFEWGNFHNNCIFRQKKVTNSVTPSALTAEKVDITIDMRSKTLRWNCL